MTLSNHQRDLIRSSFQSVAALGNGAGHAFYDRLFRTAPQIRPMFPEDVGEQAGKLTMALKLVVDTIGDLPKLTQIVEALARRHVAYGVEAGHYPLVGQVLLETLGDALGDDFTAETREAWAAAYGLLSERMIAAAYRQAA